MQMTELEMSQFFSAYGEVKDAKIITDRDGGKSRGYAEKYFTLVVITQNLTNVDMGL